MKKRIHILNLKYEEFFWTPSRDNENDKLISVNNILELRKDLKLIKNKIKTNDFTINDLSKDNPSIYQILIDRDFESALICIKKEIRRLLNIRFYKERMKKFLNLTGNSNVDDASIKLLEECRYLLQKDKATIKEIIKILPSNHRLNLTISVNTNNLGKLNLNF